MAELPRRRPRVARRDPRQLPPLGRHRDSLRAAQTVRERRPRLLRHRPQAPARTSCRNAPASSACSSTSSTRSTDEAAFADADLDHRRRRREQPHARAPRGRLRAGHRRAQVPLHLARHDAEVRRLHLCLRAHRARLVPDPRLPVQRGPLDGHRRDARGDLARARPGRVRHRRSRSPSASSCSRATSAATALQSNAQPPARLGVAELQPRAAASAGTTAISC